MNYLISAIADGIVDAECKHFSNYPGFHSNELHSALHAQYTSTDEKNAFAFAWGCSMAGERAAVSFKNVGLNDAADAFLGAHFVGCRAGLVLFLFDDCDIQHSQNRIDVRPYFLIYGGLWLEPRSVPEAYELTKKAFQYSEEFQIPVVLRITNILFDMGLFPTKWERKIESAKNFPPLNRSKEFSPFVVHPSEAHRMEAELLVKNQKIKNFVEQLYDDQPLECSPEIIVGAKRNVVAESPFRLFTLPLPEKALRKRFCSRKLADITVYEHGGTPFMLSQISSLLQCSPVRSRMMAPPPNIKPKYHNFSFMEKLFGILRNIPDSIICGDLGNFTMDPERTLQLCLCYGISPAVSMGVVEASHKGTQVFCITGDAAYLHSGQQCLYEMTERKTYATIFVLENGGALGTGGQYIPGDLLRGPQSVHFQEVDYLSVSQTELANLITDLPQNTLNVIIIHTGEKKHEH